MLNFNFFKKNLLSKPKLVFWHFPLVCNLKCNHCEIGKKTQKDSFISKTSILDKLKIVDKLYEWMGPGFSLSFIAGEPLMNKDIFKVIKHASSKNIVTSITSNGTLINSDEVAKSIINSGLNYIAFSLDGVSDYFHDNSRGVVGTRKRVVGSIERLLRVRKEIGSVTPKVYVNSIIMKNNIDELRELIDWVDVNNLDGITFQPIASTSFFSGDDFDNNWFTKSDLWPDKNKSLDFIDYILKNKNKKHFLRNTVKDLYSYKQYFIDPQKYAINNKCIGMSNTLTVLDNGDICSCVAISSNVSNIFEDELKNIWNSKKMILHRKKVFNCKDQCKILGCNKEDFYF